MRECSRWSTYKYHRAKTERLLAEDPKNTSLAPLETYLERVPQDCPHELFRDNTSHASQTKQKFNLDEVVITPKENTAVQSARFALQAVARNKLRHEVLQDFMLVNDSVTVSVEVPIVLTAEDLAHYCTRLGFDIPLFLEKDGVITGHIDIVQIRNGMVHILDYKPGARKVKPIEQLMIYALALSRLTRLRLYHFKCTWFDDQEYYEFYPLHVVHKRRG